MYFGFPELRSRGERSSQSAKGELFCGVQLHRRCAFFKEKRTAAKLPSEIYRTSDENVLMENLYGCGAL